MDVKRMLVDPRVAALVVLPESMFRFGAEIRRGTEQLALYALWLSQQPDIYDNEATLQALGAILDRPDTSLESVKVGGYPPLTSVRIPTTILFSMEHATPEDGPVITTITAPVGTIPDLLTHIPIVITVTESDVEEEADDLADEDIEILFPEDGQ